MYDARAMTKPPYIGVTGPNASGKGEVANHLHRVHGYHCRSLSDVIREEARRRGQEPVRGVLIPLGNELRENHGPGALAELILPDLEPPTLIDSIRNPVEVEVLRGLEGFVLIAVSAPEDMRFERSLARARPGDPRSREEYREREAQENSSNPAAQQLAATAELADFVLVNDAGLDDLGEKLDALLARIGGD
jgi:dephospho-CoA kinase